MKKIIILFLMFASIVFAEWKYGISHNDYGKTFHDFTVYDIERESIFQFSVTTDIYPGYSSILISNDKIKKNAKLSLSILDNSDDLVDYKIYKEDIKNGLIGIHSADRGDTLTKMLVSAQVVMLYNDSKGELLAFFDLEGLKEILDKKLGNSDWYKYKLND